MSRSSSNFNCFFLEGALIGAARGVACIWKEGEKGTTVRLSGAHCLPLLVAGHTGMTWTKGVSWQSEFN